jgi:hypothetical protein
LIRTTTFIDIEDRMNMSAAESWLTNICMRRNMI